MNIQSIHMDNTNRCRVVAGPSGRTFFSTPQAVGLALLGIPTPSDDASAASGNIVWTDYLATNGVAIGNRGNRRFHLVTLPAKMRTVSYTEADAAGRSVSTPLNIVFPPILAGLAIHQGVHERSVLFLVDMTRQAQMNVASNVPILTTFPYGNVHETTGHICWGGVRTADIRTMQDMEDLFFGSGFNRDLYRDPTGSVASLKLMAARPGGIPPAIPANRFTITIPSAIASLMRASD